MLAALSRVPARVAVRRLRFHAAHRHANARDSNAITLCRGREASRGAREQDLSYGGFFRGRGAAVEPFVEVQVEGLFFEPDVDETRGGEEVD